MSQEVNTFVNTVSRPFSAFNRLGSYVDWGSIRTESIITDLADNGFFFRENLTVSQFENPGIEIPDLSADNLFNQGSLQDYLGSSNRLLNSLVSCNVPLHKTLNYLGPKSYNKEGVLDVITSPNSDFILTGQKNGSCHLNIASLRLQNRKIVNMFDSDKKNKLKKHRQVMEKLFQRLTSFEEYNQGIAKKGQPIGILSVPNKPAVSSKDASNSEEEAIAEKMKQKVSQMKITKK